MRRQLIYLVVTTLVLGISAFAYADPDAVCNDLHRLACAPGTYSDGTGSAATSTALANAENEISTTVLSSARDGFMKALQNPENAYFRKEVLSAAGLSLSDKCADAEVKPSAACLNDMVDGATDIFAKQQQLSIFNSSVSNNFQSSMPVTDITYVVSSLFYRQIQKSALVQAQRLLQTEDFDKKVKEKVFPQIKAMLLARIDQMITDPKIRKNLTDKINAIGYDGADCSSGAGATSVPGLLTANAFYDPSSNMFKYCSGMTLQNKSEFQIAFVIAHELSHSIDPCGITMGPSDYAFKYSAGADRAKAMSEYPIQGVASCLSSVGSVHARAASERAPYGASGGYGATYGSIVTKSSAEAPGFDGFCKNDQITEAFADWMAADLTPEYIAKNYPNLSKQQSRNGYSNIFRGQCPDDITAAIDAARDPHPVPVDRDNRNILANPKIRAQMGCPAMASDTIYCAPPGVASDKTNDAAAAPKEPVR